MDLIEFEGDLEKFAQQVKVDYAAVVKRTAFDLFTRIVQKTPVDTGRARASWNIAIGAPDPTVAPEGPQPLMNQASAEAKAAGALAALGENGVMTQPIWISNNLPYITVLEYGGYPNPVKYGTRLKKRRGAIKFEVSSIAGFSTQAPKGMVVLSINEVTLKMNLLTKVPE